jgi:RNA polymerase sigma-70 factor (ECF subfamily)
MQAPEPSLLQRALQEERKAQLELYRICFPVLISVVRRYHANDDEQVTLVNNAYLKILKGLAQYNDHNYFFSWIKRIITNEVIDHFRRGKHYRELFAMDQEIPLSAATFAMGLSGDQSSTKSGGGGGGGAPSVSTTPATTGATGGAPATTPAAGAPSTQDPLQIPLEGNNLATVIDEDLADFIKPPTPPAAPAAVADPAGFGQPTHHRSAQNNYHAGGSQCPPHAIDWPATRDH